MAKGEAAAVVFLLTGSLTPHFSHKGRAAVSGIIGSAD